MFEPCNAVPRRIHYLVSGLHSQTICQKFFQYSCEISVNEAGLSSESGAKAIALRGIRQALPIALPSQAVPRQRHGNNP